MSKNKTKTKNNNRNNSRRSRRRRQNRGSRRATIANGYSIRNNNPMKTMRIRHTEYIRDIFGTTSDEAYKWMAVNPGLHSTFPWLSKIASNFETYKFKSLAFIYKPNCATTTAGSVTLSPDYDPTDRNIGSKATKSSYMASQDTVTGSYWATQRMQCSPRNLAKRTCYYVRDAILPGTDHKDKKLYDVCSLYVVRTSSGGTTNLGTLWVEYDVELQTPQVEPHVKGAFSLSNETTDIPVGTPFVDDGTKLSKLSDLPLQHVTGSSTAIKILEAIQGIITFAGRATGTSAIALLYPLVLKDYLGVNLDFTEIHKYFDTSETTNSMFNMQYLVKGLNVNEEHPATLEWPGLSMPNGTYSDLIINYTPLGEYMYEALEGRYE